MSKKRGVYILGAKRTPFGKFFGSLKNFSAVELASEAIGALTAPFNLGLSRSDIGVDGVILGNVLSAGLGQAPARNAMLKAGLPEHCHAVTVNKVCASSLFALESATEKIQLGKSGLMIAGGMESMSQAPYLLKRRLKTLESGFEHRLDDVGYENDRGSSCPYATDSMIWDGLFNTMTPAWKVMGEFADDCAKVHNISREEQEAYAYESFMRSRIARELGRFSKQIIPVGKVDFDECPREPDIDKMRALNSVFSEDGTVTGATSAQISDGAAVLLLGDSRTARRLGVNTRIRLVDFVTHSQHPHWYTTAPIEAIKKIMRRNKLKVSDVLFFEINEAFAVVPIFTMRQLGIRHEKLNVWGGAIALGHPLGASGTRIVMNIAQQLGEFGGRYGIACACNGGGEAVAVLVENIKK